VTFSSPGTGVGGEDSTPGAFSVRLDNFEGPFDLLLSLIAKHELDITEVALSQVTDEFLESVKALGADADLESTSSFLVVAATLLDLKVVRLLPSATLEDEEDLSLLEARDLLFARLLQYRAFKEVAGLLGERMARESRRHPRPGGAEERFAAVLPDVAIPLSVEAFAEVAVAALQPRRAEALPLAHLHAPAVSVREQAVRMVERLRRSRVTTFRSLTSDSPDPLTTVARFLALLELFREAAVAFDQVAPLGDLQVRWTGTDTGDVVVLDEFDQAPVPEFRGAEPVSDGDVSQLAGVAT
jgi:segregation and condensation protein A